MIVYRLLSFIVGFYCAFIAVNVLLSIPVLFTQPLLLLVTFVFVCVVLYGWFSKRFYSLVVINNKKMSKRQKELLQVNAVVSFLFSSICVLGGIQLLWQPTLLNEAMKNLPAELSKSSEILKKTMIAFLILNAILFIHIIWTYTLIRKNKTQFDA